VNRSKEQVEIGSVCHITRPVVCIQEFVAPGLKYDFPVLRNVTLDVASDIMNIAFFVACKFNQR
jgi:hypothetical protein